MNNAEASGSDDDEEDKALDEIAAAVIEAEGIAASQMEVDPQVQREQEIIAEVARRRASLDAAATKRKSDEIFEHFDVVLTRDMNCETFAVRPCAPRKEFPWETNTLSWEL